MHEMRITPELPAFAEIVHGVFLELIDGKLTTPEEMRSYLEPHSPPAPPPQVTVKKTRARRSAEARVKELALDEEEEEDSEDPVAADEDLEPIGTDEELDLSVLPKGALAAELVTKRSRTKKKIWKARKKSHLSEAIRPLPLQRRVKSRLR